MAGKKLRIGWFTFTCCEDSTIIFTELLNTHYLEWLEKIEFVHAKVLTSDNRWEPMDVAFVEGAITSDEQEEKLKKIRSLSTKLIAIGACACTGMPSAQRNHFNEEAVASIRDMLERYHHNKKVKTLRECVTVDATVPGCPMTEVQFVNMLNSLFSEFNINQ